MRSELWEAAGIPLTTRYLVDTLDRLERAGMIDRVDDGDEESRFPIDTTPTIRYPSYRSG